MFGFEVELQRSSLGRCDVTQLQGLQSYDEVGGGVYSVSGLLHTAVSLVCNVSFLSSRILHALDPCIC